MLSLFPRIRHHITWANAKRFILSFKYPIVAAAVLLFFAELPQSMIDLSAKFTTLVQWIAGWPDDLYWRWIFILIAIALLLWGVYRAGATIELKQNKVKSLLADATKLPLLMARRDMQQTIINEFERRFTAIEKSRGEVNKWFRSLNENGKHIPMGDGMAPTQPHELTDTLKTAAQYVEGVEENDVPEFKPSRPHPEPNGPPTVFVVSKNNGYMKTVSTYIWDTQQIQKKLQRHLQDEQEELRNLNDLIRNEMQRLLSN